MDKSVFHFNDTVANRCKVFVVGYDDDGLTEFFAHAEKQLVEFLFVF